MTGFLIFTLLAMAVMLWMGGRRHRIRGALGAGSTGVQQDSGPVLSRSVENRPGHASIELSVTLSLDLLAAMISNGTTLVRSLECLARAAPPRQAGQLQRVCMALRMGVDWETAWSLGRHNKSHLQGGKERTPRPQGEVLSRPGFLTSDKAGDRTRSEELERALALTALTGAGASAALRAQAAQVRRRTQREAQKRASRLGVRLVVPLGVCVLPAFIVLGVIPVVISVIPQLW